jgi:hypothetical protein
VRYGKSLQNETLPLSIHCRPSPSTCASGNSGPFASGRSGVTREHWHSGASLRAAALHRSRPGCVGSRLFVKPVQCQPDVAECSPGVGGAARNLVGTVMLRCGSAVLQCLLKLGSRCLECASGNLVRRFVHTTNVRPSSGVILERSRRRELFPAPA